jgi:hypothetical protein
VTDFFPVPALATPATVPLSPMVMEHRPARVAGAVRQPRRGHGLVTDV